MSLVQQKNVLAFLTIVSGAVFAYFALLPLYSNYEPGYPPPANSTIIAAAASGVAVLIFGLQWRRISARAGS